MITIAALLLVGAFLLLMTRLRSPQAVLSPPNPGGEYRQLQQAFERTVGKDSDYRLQYPEEGDYRSAYVLKDLDGDDEDEALVFYSKPGKDSVVRINILDLVDDEWVSVMDKIGYGNKIDSVSFSDLDRDGNAEVALSWSLAGADSNRTLTVHSVDLEQEGRGRFETLANMPYKAMHISDMDNDGNNEILILWSEVEKKVQHNYAALMKLTVAGLSRYGEAVEIDSTASVYDNIVLQAGKTPIAFVDARMGDGTMFTEVLWWDGVNKKLKAPFTANETRTKVATVRASDLLTSDIDEDGVYEIPVAYNGASMPSSGRDQLPPVPLTVWSRTGTAEPGVLKPAAYSLVDTENHYILYLDAGYRDSVLAYRDSKTGVLTVYEWNDDGSRGEPLFSLVYQDDGSNQPLEKYTFLASSKGRMVYGTLTSAGKAIGLSNAQIEDQIVFY